MTAPERRMSAAAIKDVTALRITANEASELVLVDVRRALKYSEEL